MPFVPHTEHDIQTMLRTINVPDIAQLFDEIPPQLMADNTMDIPAGLSEMQASRLAQERAALDEGYHCYLGAGAYQHYIPACVWEITTRGEFMTAYTPYQAEASQGSLQVIYEYQSMMAHLMGMDVSNASLYDGASSCAEAVLMAVRSHKSKTKKIIVPDSLHPFYRHTLQTIVSAQGIECIAVPFCAKEGVVLPNQLDQQDITAVIIPQPNFLGCLEYVDEITTWAHKQGALVIGVVNPTAMALFKEPGAWGDTGADIVCGEGQPLGIPLASGGPYFGFLCCKQALIRQMPGRIVGRTVDTDGREGFTLTLQAREQHIRRSRARSNICTNQGLAVTAATIYMGVMGSQGLARVAAKSYENTVKLSHLLSEKSGVEKIFTRPHFHEIVVKPKKPVAEVLHHLRQNTILGGLALSEFYPAYDNTLLIAVTETKTDEDLQHYANHF